MDIYSAHEWEFDRLQDNRFENDFLEREASNGFLVNNLSSTLRTNQRSD